MIKAVIFDYFGVIAVNNYWTQVHEFAHKNGDGVAIHEAGQNVSAGSLSWDDFCNIIAKQTGETPKSVDKKFHELNLNKELIIYAHALKTRGFKIALLSNASSEYLTPILKQSGLIELFNAVVVSSDIGFTKPDSRAFRACLEKLDIEPEETIMIDDIASNIYGAEQAGLHALQFSTNSQLKNELEKLLADSNN